MNTLPWIVAGGSLVLTSCSAGAAPPNPGASGAGGSSASTGAGGASFDAAREASAIDQCILVSMTSCQAATCHNAETRASGLLLTPQAITVDYQSLLVDKPNVGMPGVTAPGDERGCIPGNYKLIDSTNAESSLIYMKAIPKGDPTQPPCGTKMPVVGAFSAADRACILRWIETVIVARQAP